VYIIHCKLEGTTEHSLSISFLSLHNILISPHKSEKTPKSKGIDKQMFFDSKTTIITKVIIMHSKTKTFFTIIYSFSNQIMTTIVYLIFKQLGMSSGCYSMVVEKNNCIQPNERAMNGLNNQW
jgi:hypothetical protein